MEILLVEDDLEDAGLTIEALRKGDVPCRISLVRDGEEALEFLEPRSAPAPRQPDLILLDLHLPKIGGREVLAGVKADETLPAHSRGGAHHLATHREILQSENLHVESYLTKPFDLAEFNAVVKSLRKFMLADVLLPQ